MRACHPGPASLPGGLEGRRLSWGRAHKDEGCLGATMPTFIPGHADKGAFLRLRAHRPGGPQPAPQRSAPVRSGHQNASQTPDLFPLQALVSGVEAPLGCGLKAGWAAPLDRPALAGQSPWLLYSLEHFSFSFLKIFIYFFDCTGLGYRVQTRGCRVWDLVP